ncbi:hypothetical protein GBL_1030 [Geobacillus kaustophilus GBlys]|uniref:Uncharacterized protein n=1 Tax=Geobacillus kaustophilus GBlys TaxID=1337888 RepID=U2Y847_GEOKU|nr:hypothetical protein GBL_1030 [Geobacillus kaustophilus GBlys]
MHSFCCTWMAERSNGSGAASFPFRHPLGRSSLVQSYIGCNEIV